MHSNEVISSEWVVAVLVVKFDEKYGQQICAQYPEHVLSEGVISDLKMMSMPECAQADVCHSYKYTIRVRIKDHPTNPNTFYNCFTAFQQRKDPSSARGFFQQSVILVCKYPIQQLAYSVLGRLLEVLEDIPQFRNKLAVAWSNVSAGAGSDSDLTPTSTTSSSAAAPNSTSTAPSFILPDVMSIVEVAYQHFIQWPDLKELFNSAEARSGSTPPKGKAPPGHNMVNYSLPFYGSIFTVNMPFTVFHPFSTLFAHTSSGTVCSIMEVFEPLGLLPHVFLLWECIMRGKDIVVYSPSAATCSAVVTTLLSLIAPPLHCFTGDVRPFISLYDSDTKVFAKHINRKYKAYGDGNAPGGGQSSDNDTLPSFSIYNCDQYISNNGIFDSNKERTADFTLPAPGAESAAVSDHPRSSIIIGVTNPFLLKDYNYVDVVLLLANPDYLPVPKSSLSLSTAVGSLKDSLAGNLDQIRRRPSVKMFSDMFASAISATAAVQPPVPPSAPQSFSYEQCTIPDSVVRIIDDTNSERHPQEAIIEHYYDKWVARGGLQGKCGGIICVRQYCSAATTGAGSVLGPARQEDRFSISEDRMLLGQIGWYSAASNEFLVEALEKRKEQGLPPVTLNSGHTFRASVTPLSSTLTVIRSAVVPFDSAAATGQGSCPCARYDSDRYVIGNKLLKEAFRNLTLACLRPFAPFCSVDNDIMGTVDAQGETTSLSPVESTTGRAEMPQAEDCQEAATSSPSAAAIEPTCSPPQPGGNNREVTEGTEVVAAKPSEESVFIDSSAAEMASSAFSTGTVSPVPPGTGSEQHDRSVAIASGVVGDRSTATDAYRVYDVDAALANYQYLLPLWELPSTAAGSQPCTQKQVMVAMKSRALAKSIPESYYAKACPTALRRCTVAEYTEFLSDISGTAHCHAYIQYKRNMIYRKIVQGLCDSYARLTLTQVLFDYQTELWRDAGKDAAAELDVDSFTAEQVHALLGRMRRCWQTYISCVYPRVEALGTGTGIAGPSTRDGAPDDVCAGMQKHYKGVSALLMDCGHG